MLFKYIAGNNIKSAITVSNKLLDNQKIPIINYAIEESKNKKLIFKEHSELISELNSNFKIAIKLSSFEFNKSLVNDIIEKAKSKNIQIVIDAEKGKDYNKYQELVNDLILYHNIDKCNVVKTYQMYRKDSLNELKDDIIFYRSHDKFLGSKLVRGAYWNSEYKLGYLYTNKNDTDKNYNKGLKLLSNNYNKNYNILASHNDYSINYGLTINKSNKKKIFEFAHLMGMKDKKFNYIKSTTENVHVYIPYGPYKEMIPYLFRRLYENMDTIKYMI
jgi:proline dehydrogenase